MTEQHQEYDDNLTAVLEAVWGEGFMSPGGVAEVDNYLQGINLEGLSVLDIGCGLGGVDLHLLKQHKAARVTGIDIDASLIERCNDLAKRHQIQAQTEFICVEPGPLAFADASFDIVTSKDSIIHIADKHALAADIFRVLKPGGWFVASDWMAGYDGEPSADMQAYLTAEGLDFGLASLDGYEDALSKAGFTEIALVDRNHWYRQQARTEREQLKTEIYDNLRAKIDTDFLASQIEVWDKMIIVLDQGELRPGHLRGRKPDTISV